MSASPVADGVIDVHRTARIEAPRPTVYTCLLDIGSWWPHRFRDGSYVVLESHVGGRFYEDWDSGGALYGTVSRIERDEHLTVTGLLGIPEAVAGRFDLHLTDTEDGATTVTLTHQAMGRISTDMAEDYRVGWDTVLDALREFAAGRAGNRAAARTPGLV